MRTVRCYAEDEAGGWVAVCVDFDLAVQGDTFEEVYASLNQAIEDYLEDVAELPAEERARFFKRRAPLLERLRFLWVALRGGLWDATEDSPCRRAAYRRSVRPLPH